MKRCPCIGAWKHLDDFDASSDRWDGKQSTCKQCKARKRAKRSAERYERLTAEARANLDERRTCRVCGRDKPIAEFAISPRSYSGFSKKCLTCIADDARKPNAKTRQPDYARNRVVERVYGISPEQYSQLRDAQNDLCAICGKPETRAGASGKPTTLCVDHDHATGGVRGLLCNRCNAALGQLGDDIALLHRAIDYLVDPPWARIHGATDPAVGMQSELINAA